MNINDKPMLMGILNVTPDSFSDGGQHNKPKAAIKRAFEMQKQGADIIDIGGESTRPGAETIDDTEQIARVIPVIEGIRKKNKTLLISVDTTSNHVAEVALDAGANWINDISAGEDSLLAEGSSDILNLAAKKNAPIVLMHRQGKSQTMQDAPYYDDVCKEVCEYLKARAELAMQSGVAKENIMLDPGIGFGKTFEHNLLLLNSLESLVALGYPILLGTSRKRFLGEITGVENAQDRIASTCATTALGVNAGIQIFRV
ncbi:MAG: dihydropteroate synthase, partial [Cocleimonas sp.]